MPQSADKARSRALINRRAGSGRPVRIRASRRSGNIPSQMTSATIPIDVIVSVMKNKRKACIAHMIAWGSDPARRLALKYIAGRISPGVARNARLQITTCACGKPGGIRSLSKNLAKNARARSSVRVRASSPRRDRSPCRRCRFRSRAVETPARARRAPSAPASERPNRARRHGRR